jgi:TPR repeat protein
MQFPYKKTFTISAMFGMFFTSQALYAGYEEGLAAFNKKDYAQAIKEWKPLAEQGGASAQGRLGVMYRRGLGVPQDNNLALVWYRKAAEQGDASGQANLGMMYFYGEGVPQDYKLAVEWISKAAEQGFSTAQFNLGVMYDNGQGVPKDDAQAMSWYRKAAEQGDAAAQFKLGSIYDYGAGVPKDDAQAMSWYRKAAEQGDAAAQRAIVHSEYRRNQKIAAAEQKRKNELATAEQQRKTVQAAEDARLRKMSNQSLVKTLGQKVCTDGSGSAQVFTGYVVLGKPAYQTQSNKFFLKGTTEQVAGGRILVRVSSILMQSPYGQSEYINQLNGDPTYQINQVTWDDAMSWDLCN